MLFDWLKTPVCKICTNKRNAKRSGIIRLSSNGKTGVAFKLNWLCQPQNSLIHLLHCSMVRTEAREPLCFSALPLSQCNPCLSNAILKSSSISTPSLILPPALVFSLPGTHRNGTKESRLKAQTVMSDLQSTYLLSDLGLYHSERRDQEGDCEG